jgi:TolA-binding protein
MMRGFAFVIQHFANGFGGPTMIRALACMAVAIFLSSLLGGCAGPKTPNEEIIGKTLADLQPARLPDTDAAVPKVSLDDIEASYRRALQVAENEAVRRQILVRLAGLEMIRSEHEQLNATGRGRFFNGAIALYRELIELQAGQPGRDKLLYQLAKAYALDGRTGESAQVLDQLAREYPNSPYLAEAEFRRAERAFSDGDYMAAEDHYRAVVTVGEDSPFIHNARYMLGWAQFKRNRYRESLVTFTLVLDSVVAAQGSLEGVQGPQKNLVDDTLRVMSLVFSHLDGAKTISQTYQKLGWRPYNHLLYQRLGDLYLEKKRYRDSAETSAHFVAQYPNSDYAPGFSVRIVDVYDQGDFPSLLLPAKEDFVTRYGIHSAYWAQKPAAIRNYLRPYLHGYLQELARYSHAQAQALSKRPSGSKRLSGSKRPETATAHYEKAARWYEAFVESFPKDEKTPDTLFLLGEAYYESGHLAKAIAAYERVAYEFADPEKGAEAGYSAILAANQLIETGPVAEREQWRKHRTESAMNFADHYPGDQRAPAVLTHAAQDLLAGGEFRRAVTTARRLTEWQPPVEPALLKTAWLIAGQGHFDLDQYAEAEQAYRQVLSLMPAGKQPAQAGNQPVLPKQPVLTGNQPVPAGKQPTLAGRQLVPAQQQKAMESGPTRQQVIERLAASLFKQAEQRLAANDKAGAIGQLQRVSALAPETAIGINAAYDAAVYLMDLERWPEAERQLIDFRTRYPRHALAATLPAKLVLVYQAMEKWRPAADELRSMADSDKDPELRRQSLIMAAELYERSGVTDQAIPAYRAYANTYSKPFAETLEAANKLVTLYGKTGDIKKRDFWLNKLITLDAKAGGNRSDRSRYLAAKAASELADRVYQRFVSLPLTLPLKASLARKRHALEETLQAYQQVLDYGVAEFATLANYRIGAVYVQLSRALLESERPADLDALALEQYEILLEEQAFPFEERAIEILETNAQRSWDGIYDQWVQESFERLANLLPARYRKQEDVAEYSHAIH